MSDQNHTTPVEYRETSRFPGYRFGNDGSAWTCWPRNGQGPQTTVWRRLSGMINRDGYREFSLKDITFGGHAKRRLGRLVLEAFVGPCPDGMECRHLDGDSTNDSLENLAWGTPLENSRDKKLHGTFVPGQSLKFTAEQINEMRKRFRAGVSKRQLARIYGVCIHTIRRHVPGI